MESVDLGETSRDPAAQGPPEGAAGAEGRWETCHALGAGLLLQEHPESSHTGWDALGPGRAVGAQRFCREAFARAPGRVANPVKGMLWEALQV